MAEIPDRYFRCVADFGFDGAIRNPTHRRHSCRRANTWRILEKGRNLAERIPQSLVLLAARVAIADIFWRSGQTKVNGFALREETFYLFREEYKVPLLPPDLAAYLATIGEHVFPILLVIGLATRLSALGSALA